ncbi:hypothetical protein O9K51_04645 [Purpureocillium lavendulum]|uniref:Uncharacterized protein n=1 Tax=Purpureocillium lavendulum TaxID=1247861 RepID=A0AB34FXT9_9HYPO|nr:hypothetical protein O9K51_04645 [Purpureocillium lavendulum]
MGTRVTRPAPELRHLAFIANLEGLLRINLQSLSLDEPVSNIQAPRNLRSRTAKIAQWHNVPLSRGRPTFLDDANDPGAVLAILSHEVAKLYDYVHSVGHIKSFISIPVTAPTEASVQGAKDEAMSLLGTICRHYINDKEKRLNTIYGIIRTLRRDTPEAFEKQVAILVVQESAYLLGRLGFALTRAPETIKECELMMQECAQESHFINQSAERKSGQRSK